MPVFLTTKTLHDFADPPITFQQRLLAEDNTAGAVVRGLTAICNPDLTPVFFPLPLTDVVLLTAAAATGAWQAVAKGVYVPYVVAATWNGANVQFEFSNDNGAALVVPISAAVFDGDAMYQPITLPDGWVRAKVNPGGSSPIGITAVLGAAR